MMQGTQIATLFLGAVALVGCSVWHPMEPPIANALGRHVEKNRLGKSTIGAPAMTLSPAMIRIDDSKDTFTNSEYSSFQANLMASFNNLVGAEADVNYEASNIEVSSGWKVMQISNFSSAAPLNSEFVYKCLTNEEYSFETTSALAGGGSVDNVKLAEAFGTPVVNISVASVPSAPNRKKVTIKNPAVCLSYVAARLDPIDKKTTPKSTAFTKTENGASKTSFNLGHNGSSDQATLDLGTEGLDNKPMYRLIYSGTEEAPSLRVQIVDLTDPANVHSIVLSETTPGSGHWEGVYGLENFQYESMKFLLARLKINARLAADNTVDVASATIFAPTYKLSLK